MLTLARRRAPLAAFVVGVVALASGCLPYTSQEQYLFNHTNQLRHDQGINALGGMDALTSRARELAQQLAFRRTLVHSDLQAMGVRWTAAAENIGRGGSIEQVFTSLQASPPHRANMLDAAYTNTGIGTARSRDGQVYVVQLFVRQ